MWEDTNNCHCPLCDGPDMSYQDSIEDESWEKLPEMSPEDVESLLTTMERLYAEDFHS